MKRLVFIIIIISLGYGQISSTKHGIGLNIGDRGAGIFYHRSFKSYENIKLGTTIRWLDIRPPEEIPIWNYNRQRYDIKNTVSLAMFPLFGTINYYPFEGKIANNFSPYISTKLGPVLVLDADEDKPLDETDRTLLAQFGLFNDVDMVHQSSDKNGYVYDLVGSYKPAKSQWPTFQGNVHRNGKFGFEVPTAVDGESTDIPVKEAALLQNYPNPFNPVTRIVYLVPEGALRSVTLVIYDVTGARVRTLVNGQKAAGRYEEIWDARDDAGHRVGSGVYFYRFEFEGFASTKKLVLLK